MSSLFVSREHTGTQDDISKHATSRGYEEDEHPAPGWLGEHVESNLLSDTATQIQNEIHYLRGTANSSEQQELRSMEEHCCEQFAAVIKAGALKEVKEGKRNRFLRKVSVQSANFCEIALHYQNVFDVLSNAGDYTSAIWGAVKLLMIYKVNDKVLESEVKRRLCSIGEWLTEISTFGCIPKTRLMQHTITKIYARVLDFLSQALKFYKENKLKQFFNTLTQPWERRFEPIVKEAQSSIQAVTRMMHAVVLNITEQLKEKVINIEKVFINGNKDVISMFEEGYFTIIQEQRDIMKNLRALQPPERECKAAGLWDEREKLLAEHNRHIVDENDVVADYSIGQLRIQFEAIFPCLTRLRETDELRHKKYKPSVIMQYEDDSPSVSNLQWSLKKHTETQRWTEQQQSHFLMIEGYQESLTFDWTTRFSMDIQRLATSIGESIVLSFFGGAKELDSTPSSILQAFIHQMILQRWQKFTGAVCVKHAISIDRLQDCGNNFSRLWSLFAVCLEVAQVSCVFVILDNIDGMLETSKAEDLHLLSRFLKGLAHSQAPICKILATSRINRLSTTKMDAASSACSDFSKKHFTILRIPRSHRIASDFAPRRQKHRLSIVRETILRVEDVMIADIIAEDEQREEDLKSSNVALSDDGDEDIDSLFGDDAPSRPAREPDTTSASQAQETSSEVGSLDDHSDTDLSDLFGSDDEDTGKFTRRSHALKKDKLKGCLSDPESSEDELLRDVLDSDDDDLDLSDSDIELDSKHIKSNQKVRKDPIPIGDDSGDDYDLDSL